MKAMVQTGPGAGALEERDEPTPDDDEVLVRVHPAGICGSDAHAYRYDVGYEWVEIPRIMDHEYAGTVEAVGADVDGFEPGDRVVEEPVHDCGRCFQCSNGQSNVCQRFSVTGMHRDGAYAEYTVVDSRKLHPVPAGVLLDDAAITEPTSVAARAVFDRSRTTPGEFVLVEGPYPIGVLVASIAHSLGANVLVSGLDRDAETRLPVVEALGIETVNVEAAALAERRDAVTAGRGFDVVFDTTGHASGVEVAVDHVRKGGQIVVGLPGGPSGLFVTPLVRGEVDLHTSYGSTWTNFEQALRLLENGSVDADAIVDDSFGIEAPAAAFEAFLRSETVKPMFRFDGG